MLVSGEMAFLQTQCDEQQHQHANEHVKTMEARQHEKGGTVHTGAQLEVELMVSVVILVALHKQEHHAQRHGKPHEGDRPCAFAFNQGMVSDGQCHA